MRKTFIYALVDPRDDSVKYIGKSIEPEKRLKSHVYLTQHTKKRKTKKEFWIQKLINSSLVPQLLILCECDDIDAGIWEEFYIKKYKLKNLTNFDEKGIGKIAKPINLGTLNQKKLSRSVLQYDINGKFITEYKSLRDAERATLINHSNISRVCNKVWKHTNGFIFRFKNDKSKIVKILKPNSFKKEILKLNSSGKILEEYKSISHAAKANDVDSSLISRICNNKIKHKKHFFKFKNI